MQLNLVALITATVATMAIGMLWYSPYLFGKPWMKLMEWKEKDLKKAKEKGMAGTFSLAFIGAFVMATALGYLLRVAGAGSFAEAMQLGLWAWIGLVVTTTLTLTLWEQRKWGLFWMTNAYTLVVIIINVLILFSWQ